MRTVWEKLANHSFTKRNVHRQRARSHSIKLYSTGGILLALLLLIYSCFPATLNVFINGSGTIVSLSPNDEINCTAVDGDLSGTCSASFGSNRNVKLKATPADGYKFARWEDCPEPTSTNICEFFMRVPTFVTAKFVIDSGPGSGSGGEET
jgi:hypothetical protein